MTNASNLPRDIGSQDIRVIGPRRSGKTTFMAALARWPHADPASPIQSVEPYTDEAGELISLARDILEDGKDIAGTDYSGISDDLPIYTLMITFRAALLKNPIDHLRGKPLRIQVSCREYSGELMNDLRSSIPAAMGRYRNYLDDCASASGLLFLIDGTAASDREYAQAIAVLERELNERMSLNTRTLQDFRVAIAFTKCEQPQVRVYWDRINEFCGLKFPETYRALQRWQQNWRCSMHYFYCSAYGMKGTPPKPNVRVGRRDQHGTYGVIDKPNVWRPLGLVAPLYWLQTGQIDPRMQIDDPRI